MQKVIQLVLVLCTLVPAACRKKTVLKDEEIVEERVLVNENSLMEVNHSAIDVKLEQVEEEMTAVIQAVERMRSDSARQEVQVLMAKANRGLTDARQDLRQTMTKLKRNQIPEAEEKLDDIVSDLSELKGELAAEGY